MTLASLVSDVSSVITAITALVVAVVAGKAKRTVDQVHTEVKTQNGLTIAALADRQEGRRIQTDVPHQDRTASEQHYVEGLDRGGSSTS